MEVTNKSLICLWLAWCNRGSKTVTIKPFFFLLLFVWLEKCFPASHYFILTVTFYFYATYLVFISPLPGWQVGCVLSNLPLTLASSAHVRMQMRCYCADVFIPAPVLSWVCIYFIYNATCILEKCLCHLFVCIFESCS